ncbi:MAG TPA: hypothetical protein VGR35_15980 [Tepidisphaeraceae bacterium]|nr:hypothetical protein [Tepidisphaeraceae bacterium]
MTDPPPARWPPAHSRAAAVACAALLVLFAALSWLGVRGKSATFDEPVGAVGAWTNLRLRDYRLDYEHPPLWKYWAALPNAGRAPGADLASESWEAMTRDPHAKWAWSIAALYRTDGVNGHAFVNRSRAMMLALGVALGGLIAWWAHAAWGPVAAAAATAAFALDPTFLAHAPLVKNDVAVALLATAAGMVVWRLGQAVTIGRAGALWLLGAAAVTTKFSALLIGPIVVALLLCRAAMPQPWPVGGWLAKGRGTRILAVAVLCAGAGASSYLALWAVYGFRFGPSQDPAVAIDFKPIYEFIAYKDHRAANDGAVPTAEQLADRVAAGEHGAIAEFVRFAESRRLLPQAWLAGLLYTRATSSGDDAFLLGQYRFTGWWYYLFVAMAVKTPLAILAALFGAVAVVVVVVAKARPMLRTHAPFDARWLALCLTVPPLVFALSIVKSNLNLGVRYALPIYPFLYIALGGAASWIWARWRAGRAIVIVLAVALAVESLAAFPNYIPFFNRAAGGSRGGLRLLGDSNLDWGQDLPALARWQRAHAPDRPLYLAYFGTADPAFYGIRYVNLPAGYRFGPPPRWPDARGVVAVSASVLQGTRTAAPLRNVYSRIGRHEPLAVLGGGSIYLYPFEGLAPPEAKP